MICDDVIYLVAENPEAHGIFEAHNETQRMVFCQVRSLSRYDYWRALENDLHPEYVFRLSDKKDYEGEKICIYNGKRYAIIRTNVVISNGRDGVTDGQALDLTAEPASVDATFTPITTSSTQTTTEVNSDDGAGNP